MTNPSFTQNIKYMIALTFEAEFSELWLLGEEHIQGMLFHPKII